MSFTGTVGNILDGASDAGGQVADAAEQLVDGVSDAVDQTSGDVQDAAEDGTTPIIIWIIDAATALANDAASASVPAGPHVDGARAAEAAECARTWAIVGAVISVVVVIIVTIVCTTAAGGSTFAGAALRVASAILAAAITTGVEAGKTAGAIVGAVIRSIGNTVTSSSPQDSQRVVRQAIYELRRAMVQVQSAASRKLPSGKFDPARSLASMEQMIRVTLKCIALLRRRRQSARNALLVSRLEGLHRACTAIASQLKQARPMLAGPIATGPKALQTTRFGANLKR